MSWLMALGAAWAGAVVVGIVAFVRAPFLDDEPIDLDVPSRQTDVELPASLDPLVEVRALGPDRRVEAVAR